MYTEKNNYHKGQRLSCKAVLSLMDYPFLDSVYDVCVNDLSRALQGVVKQSLWGLLYY